MSKLILWIRSHPCGRSRDSAFAGPACKRTSPFGEAPQRNHVCCLVSPELPLRRTILSPFSFQGTGCRPAAESRTRTASLSSRRRKKRGNSRSFTHPGHPGWTPRSKELSERPRSGPKKLVPKGHSVKGKEPKRHQQRLVRPTTGSEAPAQITPLLGDLTGIVTA